LSNLYDKFEKDFKIKMLEQDADLKSGFKYIEKKMADFPSQVEQAKAAVENMK